MLYHRDVYIPEGMKEKIPLNIRVEFSKHSINELENDLKRYNIKVINIHRNLNFSLDDIIEVEEENGEITKVVYRQNYNGLYDIVYAINMKDFIVKTIWLQQINDKHITLKRGKYEIH